MSRIISSVPVFLLALMFVVGIFPQSAADPLMMLPFAVMSGFLILSGRLLKLSVNDTLLFLILVFWFLLGLSGINSDVPFPSKVTWLLMGTLPVSYMIGRTINNFSPLSFLSLLCLPFAGFTIWQGLHGVIRPDTPFDDSNLLGALFAFGILSALPTTHLPHTKPIRILFSLFICILFSALAITQSRSAVIALIIGGFIYFLLNKPSSISLSKPMFFKIIGGSFMALAIIIFSGLLSRFQIFENGAIDTSILGRLSIWRGAWDMAFVHPWLGFGLGTFHLYYPAFRLEGDNSLGWMVHFDPLQIAVECGWVAAVVLYSIFAAAFILIYKQRTTLSPYQRMAAAFLVCFFAEMHLNYPLHVVPFLMIIGLSLAALSPQTNHRPAPMLASFGLLVTLLSALWIFTQSSLTFMLSNEVQKAYHALDQKRFDKAISACIEDGDKDFPDCRIMAARFLTLANDADKGRIETLLSEAEAANPTNAEIGYIRAQNLMFINPPRHDEALPLLNKSLSLNPAFWPARRMAIEILLNQADKAAARALFDKGLIYRYARQTRDDISRMQKRFEE